MLLKEMIGNNRPLLVFSKMPNRLLLVLGSGNGLDNLDDTYVFDQPVDTIEDDRKVFLKPPTRFKQKYPSFTDSLSKNMFVIRDDYGDYIFVPSEKQSKMINLVTGDITFSAINEGPKKDLLSKLTLSSREPMVSVCGLILNLGNTDIPLVLCPSRKSCN